jgi:hypothetical protein
MSTAGIYIVEVVPAGRQHRCFDITQDPTCNAAKFLRLQSGKLTWRRYMGELTQRRNLKRKSVFHRLTRKERVSCVSCW